MSGTWSGSVGDVPDVAPHTHLWRRAPSCILHGPWCFWWGLGATVICMLQAWLDAGYDAGCACAYFTLDVHTDAPYGFRARERQPRGPWGLGRGVAHAQR